MSSYTDAVMLFGDSLTESCGAGSFYQRMAEHYNRRADIINRGFGGYTTKTALPVFKQAFENTRKIRLLTIWLGANDSTLPGEIQHVPLADYKANLSTLIHLTTQSDTRILLITPTPIISSKWHNFLAALTGASGKLNRKPEITSQYAHACIEVAENHHLPVVDAHQAILKAARGSSDTQLDPYFTDGLHLTPAGYKVVFESITSKIAEVYPELDPEQLPRRQPDWDKIDLDNVEGYIADYAKKFT